MLDFRKWLSAALISVSLATAALADQSSIVTPTVGPQTAAQYAAKVNSALLAIMSCNSGSSAPANGVGGLPTPYQCWADTTTNPTVIKMYDGTSWVVVAKINTSTHLWTPVRQGTDLGTASIVNTGTSGANIPLLNGANTWSGTQSFGSGVLSATSPSFTTPSLGVAIATSLALNGCTIGSNILCVSGGTSLAGAVAVTTASSFALAVGQSGATNPAFAVDASTASSATGITVKSAAAAGGVSIVTTSSGTNEPLIINAKGTGAIAIGGVSTGGVFLGAAGGGVQATALTVLTSFTATGLIGYGSLATAAIATCSNYFAGTASTIAVPANVYCAETNLGNSGTGTFNIDFSLFTNAAITMTGNITTQALFNIKAGQAGMITFIQDATGSRTTVWNTAFKWAGGVAPSLSAAANAVDVLSYSCRSSSFCVASLLKDVK